MTSSVPQCHGEEEGLLLRNSEEELLVSSYTLRARAMGGGLLLGLIAFVLWALVPSADHSSAATSSGQSLYAMSTAEAEEAWHGAGEELGIQIWRIEKLEVVPWPKEKFGKFCDGDSYIVLNTHEEGGERHYDLHYWQGKVSSSDEYGTAAIKMAELDTFLDDKADQHREVMGYESALFKSYFNKITLMRGGVDSAYLRTGSIDDTKAKFGAKTRKLKSSLFPTAGEEVGLQIWRGSNFGDEYEVVPSEDFGKFESDRPYVVLNTFEDGAGLHFDLHGWYGAETSVDERALLMTYLQHLKDSLGAELHLEFEGRESALFRSYFDQDVDASSDAVESC